MIHILYSVLFIIHPTNARIWHKAVFKVGPVAEPKPTRIRQGQKYLQLRQHSPFLGCLRRQAINLTLLKGVKAWGDGPLRPEELSSAEAHPAECPEIKLPTECNPTTVQHEYTDLHASLYILFILAYGG